MKRNKKARIRYPKRNGSVYGTRPGLYMIDNLGHKIRLPLTEFSYETLTNRLTIGSIEFQIPEQHIATLNQVIRSILYE